MSASKKIRRLTITDILNMKNENKPIVSLTAYTTPIAKLVDQHCDIILVGDSLAMVVYGMDSTHGVSVDMMVAHTKAVMRGSEKALIVVDLPFGSYEKSPEQAFETASHILCETGATAVKLEGGCHMAETIAFLTQRGIPVMAHIGLTPQAFNSFGGYRVVGRDQEAKQLEKDAKAVEKAGAFSVVIEKIPTPLAGKITKQLSIPTIGIGASKVCDGQILVVDDMLGVFNEFKPKFVKRYAEFAETADKAIKRYADEVRKGQFPSQDHSYDK